MEDKKSVVIPRIQTEIENALENVKNRYGIDIDYTWGFNKDYIHKKCLEINIQEVI